MNLWLGKLGKNPPVSLKTPAETARFELESFFPRISFDLCERTEMGDTYQIAPGDNGSFRITGGSTGLLYGAYRLIMDKLCGHALSGAETSAPKYSLRMINCWDNADGEIERGYAGRSLFFRNGRLDYNTDRVWFLGRLLASAGLNVLCINNVNVHYPAQLLLEDYLSDLAALADLFRPFGVRLMISVDFSQPMRHGIPTADPLDPAVQAWWKETAARAYAAVPDLAGFLVKADSEGRPGPFTYGRNHAEGANKR